MNIVRIIFISLVTIMAFGISLLPAKLYAQSLRLSPHTSKVLLLLAGILPIIFIMSMVVAGLQTTTLFQKISSPVNLIAGMIFYLFITSLILGAIMLFFHFFSWTLPVSIPIVLLCVGLGLGITGAIEAHYIKVVSYTIPLSNAPKEWNKKTAVLVSDTHFGLINHKKFSDKVVNQILLLRPDFVLHAGDFYDGPKNDTVSISESWQHLTQTIPVFYTPGNHEEYGNYTSFIDSIERAGIIVLADSAVQHEGVQIAGIKYRGKGKSIEVAAALAALPLSREQPLIVINHPPIFQKEVLAIGADVMVSGHTHKGQFWPLNYATRGIYGRFFYGMEQYQNMTTITTSGVGTWGPPFRLFNTPEIVVLHFTTE